MLEWPAPLPARHGLERPVGVCQFFPYEPARFNRAMAGTRDRLIHDYFGVDLELVWDVVQTRIRNCGTGFLQLPISSPISAFRVATSTSTK